MDLYQKSQILKIKDKHDFRFTKSLGQNFLVSRNTIETIIESSDIGENDLVIEIGPGMGTLTGLAAERAGKVIAVEIDSDLIPILEETLRGHDNIEIINKDILETDLGSIIRAARAKEPGLGEVRVIGNLPYYITTPIIMKILRDEVPASSITVMMQKEVADRIKSGPGNKQYGALSVAVQYYCEVEEVCQVPAECFEPRPKVDSEVLKLKKRSEKAVTIKDEALFFAVVKAGFSQRRKTLANCMKNLIGNDRERVAGILTAAGIEAQRRAETLTLEEFAMITEQMDREKRMSK